MQLGGDAVNVNQKIEAALSGLVKDNIWPLSCPLDVPPEEYIVYLPEFEGPVEFGDDEDLEWMHYMQIHWFKKGISRKPVNYTKIRKSIRKLLKESGFGVSGIDTYYEKDTGYTHLVFSCSIEEDEPYGET